MAALTHLSLVIETGKKRHITEEEAALRKSEVARRRKNQSIQRAEKDKVKGNSSQRHETKELY
jgi:hypothetical protein